MGNGDRSTSDDDRPTVANRGTADRGVSSVGRRGSSPGAIDAAEQRAAEVGWEQSHQAGAFDLHAGLGTKTLLIWNFAVDGVTLKHEHLTALNQFVGHVEVAIETNTNVVAIGRASDSGPVGNNEDLSRRRADAARKYVRDQVITRNPGTYNTGRLSDVTALGRLDRILQVRSLGNRQPIRPNITPELMSYNRSVEIVIVPHRSRSGASPCILSVDGAAVHTSIKNLLRPRIESLAAGVRAGTPAVEVVRNSLGGSFGSGDFLLRMCCQRGKPLEVLWLLPEDPSVYRRIHERSDGSGISPSKWAEVARAGNRRLITLTRAHPCEEFSMILTRYRREHDDAMKQLLRGLIDALLVAGRGGTAGSAIQLLERMLALVERGD